AVDVERGPAGVVSDGADNLFFADSAQHTIRHLAIANRTVTTLAGSPGAAGSSDGVGEAARFASPWGVASDGAGNLLVTDTANHTVRRIRVGSGAVTTVAGSPGVAGSDDGVGSTARFNRPMGIASDGEGNFFVADADNCSIRKLAAATGAVTTVVGAPGECGIRLGPLPAQLGHPRGLAFLPPGNLFIATSAEPIGATAVGESTILAARF
ncbi:MAG: hypothetical protein JXP73_08230, partial [Deltaproteobacteria bacterium]|nr:hypothetical protein [Deltaproteobacteria bacterium]